MNFPENDSIACSSRFFVKYMLKCLFHFRFGSMLRHRFSSHLALASENWSLLPATTNFTTTVRGKKLQHSAESVHLSIHPSIYPFIFPSIHPFTNQSICQLIKSAIRPSHSMILCRRETLAVAISFSPSMRVFLLEEMFPCGVPNSFF